MNCAICGHDWCWTCGYPRNHWLFHGVMLKGFFCEFLNAITFGFDSSWNIHWTLRYSLTLLAIIFAPALFIFGTFIAFFFILKDDGGCCNELCCCIDYFDAKNAFLRFVWLLLFIVLQIPILLCLWMAVMLVILALGIIPFYIGLIFMILRLIVRWCLSSKKKVSSEERERYMKEYQEQNRNRTNFDSMNLSRSISDDHR